ncbi:hypothetical protein ASG51_17010 [Methylobacterium sp. Leaf465]|nr:hypothetical protein ASG51_17010 [Methylobacterium sp. Leaf465]
MAHGIAHVIDDHRHRQVARVEEDLQVPAHLAGELLVGLDVGETDAAADEDVEAKRRHAGLLERGERPVGQAEGNQVLSDLLSIRAGLLDDARPGEARPAPPGPPAFRAAAAAGGSGLQFCCGGC